MAECSNIVPSDEPPAQLYKISHGRHYLWNPETTTYAFFRAPVHLSFCQLMGHTSTPNSGQKGCARANDPHGQETQASNSSGRIRSRKPGCDRMDKTYPVSLQLIPSGRVARHFEGGNSKKQ